MMYKKKKRTNAQMLEQGIDDCANRIELFEKQKFTQNDLEWLRDMSWNATNVSGTISNIIMKLESNKKP